MELSEKQKNFVTLVLLLIVGMWIGWYTADFLIAAGLTIIVIFLIIILIIGYLIFI